MEGEALAGVQVHLDEEEEGLLEEEEEEEGLELGQEGVTMDWEGLKGVLRVPSQREPVPMLLR